MPDRLESMREDLLRAGLSPAHVQRYLRELAEHREDIVEHLVSSGTAPETARAEADRRLGSNDALLLPMLANRRFRSLAARWPVLAYLALPLLCQLALVAVGLSLLLVATETPLRAIILDLGNGLALLSHAAPIVFAWLILHAAHRRRAALLWPVVGAVSSVVLAAMTTINVLPAQPAQPGEISVAIGVPALLPLLALSAIALLPVSLRR